MEHAVAVERVWEGTVEVLNADARTVDSRLPVDPNPTGPITNLRIVVEEMLPVYASPSGHAAPVGVLASETLTALDPDDAAPTVLPVFEVVGQDGPGEGWAMVPVLARAGLPRGGVTGQAVGWVPLDAHGIRALEDDRFVVVDTTAGTLTIHDGDRVIHEATVGIGAPDTPTPLGRTALVASYADAAAPYTEGHPVIALARYSDTLDAFQPMGTDTGTRAAPLIAAHTWWGEKPSGAVSNGCLRASLDTLAGLLTLPAGTPVVVIR
ncbi:L,D-transpeptidase [Georgenia yuyongxinii]|uniref:L,D-transpeptidase n=1 Tax=Georgenia yuyongxinii TaxID=2589797 RepID=A0A552WU67_9MICO|nr:L,D-transpeptidase [Georgenia yuyongxinii]TRW46391.1 L,D-transpeptidase [Georgenia yuyongxinii]